MANPFPPYVEGGPLKWSFMLFSWYRGIEKLKEINGRNMD